MTPVEFHIARLDELEAAARAALEQRPVYDTRSDKTAHGEVCQLAAGEGVWGAVLDFVGALTPEAVLADIAAKRATLRLAEQQFQPHAVMDGMGWEQYENGLTAAYRAVVAHLVQPFATHPDFDESWKL